MRRSPGSFVGLSIAGLIASAAWASPALASGDYSCEPSWRLDHREMSGCDDMALLSPGNDTRTNLALLMLEFSPREIVPPTTPEPLFSWWALRESLLPKPPEGLPPPDPNRDYAEGEGSRCRSNPDGAAAFRAAVEGARKLPPAERAVLIAARDKLNPSCAGTETNEAAVASATGAVKSSAGRAFAQYLQGAAAFYDGGYDSALGQFTGLSKARDPWLEETGRYMVGRVELNRAQVNAFDEYGYPRDPAQIEAAAVDRAEAALLAYLKAYPKGQYAASARGLLRRVYWLGGRNDKLAAEYGAAFASADMVAGANLQALAQEIDNKLLPRLAGQATADPILLATLDLMRMRPIDGAEGLGRAELDGQRATFAKMPDLFTFLQASHAFHVGANPGEVLTLIPDAARQANFSSIQFSRQMLRGTALEAVKDRNARGFWMEMLPGARSPYQRATVELAIAMHDERHGALARVFAADSPVKTPAIREQLLAYSADGPLLRRQAANAAAPKHERDVALYTLLYKDLTRGAYRDFAADAAMLPADAQGDGAGWGFPLGPDIALGVFNRNRSAEDFVCPPIRETAARLAASPGDARGRLCIADFVRLNGFDEFTLDTPPGAGELGGAPSLFKGGTYSRLEVYKTIMGEAKARPDDRAYALYRAVMCYGPSGNNSCGGTEVPIETRKGWFQRLKKDHPGSLWAQKLKYYW